MPRPRKHYSFKEPVWSAPQLAAYLDRSPSWVRQRIRDGKIRVLQGGRREGEWQHYRIPIEEAQRVKRELDSLRQERLASAQLRRALQEQLGISDGYRLMQRLRLIQSQQDSVDGPDGL